MVKSRRIEILVTAVVLFVSTSPVMATLTLADGGIHDIDYAVNEAIVVDLGLPGLGTTLNILDRASQHLPYRLESWEDGITNILGGDLHQVEAHSRSQVDISGGGMFYLYAWDTSQVTVSGGLVNGFFHASGSSQVTVSGGSISSLTTYRDSQITVLGGSVTNLHTYDSSQVTVSGGSIRGLEPGGSSHVTVSGGSIDYLLADDSSHVTVSGGSIRGLLAGGSSYVTVSGGLIDVLNADFEGILIVHGSNFAVDSTPVDYIELTSILGSLSRLEPDRRLTGTLLNGDPLNTVFHIGNSAKIILVPEPTTLLLFALGGFGLLRKRRTLQ